MEQLRLVDTPAGPITYTLVRKRVKNWNLRVEPDGAVLLSAPNRCSADQADQLIREKSDWIVRSQARLSAVPQGELLPPAEKEVCLARLAEALERVYPLAAPLGVARPQLRMRRMKSQWGNCHWAQGYITLNAALARCPEELRDYVALHELIHFLHHDHGPGFRGRMDALMPDWRRRRQQLKGYASLLRD